MCTMYEGGLYIYHVGGLFEYEFEQHRQALDQAVNRVNRRSDILHDVHLTHDIETIHSHDSFAASKGGKSCFVYSRLILFVSHVITICLTL